MSSKKKTVRYDSPVFVKRGRDEICDFFRDTSEELIKIASHFHDQIYCFDQGGGLFFHHIPAILMQSDSNPGGLSFQNPQTLIPQDAINEFDRSFQHAKAGDSYSFDYSIKLGQKDYIFQATTSPLIHGENFCGTIIIVRDISELRGTSIEKELLYKSLVDQNRELEQLVRVTSHDLRSPLVNIEYFSRELKSTFDSLLKMIESADIPHELQSQLTPLLEDDIPVALKYIHASAHKMDNLLTALRKLSRISRVKLCIDMVDMNTVVQPILDSMQPDFTEKGVTVNCEKLPVCQGDENLFDQLFSSLFENSITFLSPDRAGVITITASSDEKQVFFHFRDNGIGIAKDQQKKIFDIFYKLDPTLGDGPGIGLCLIAKIVRRLNGTLHLESELDSGCLITVGFPVK